MDGNLEYIRENFNLNYTAAFIYCPLPNNTTIPTSVSIYAHADLIELRKIDPVVLPKASNRLLVNNNKETTKKQGATIAACVAPMHLNYSKVRFYNLIGILLFHKKNITFFRLGK